MYCKIIPMKAPLFIEDINGCAPFDSDNMKGFSLVIKMKDETLLLLPLIQNVT